MLKRILLLLIAADLSSQISAFQGAAFHRSSCPLCRSADVPAPSAIKLRGCNSSTILKAGDGNDDGSESLGIELAESDQFLLGGLGTFASLVTLYSEFVLKSTGCGLPAGPFGLVGLVEGLSYLGVIGIGAFSLVTKIKTGQGLPAGPSGALGAAEGLSFLAILAGLVVLALQVTNFGYIPNAVPMDGGMCS